MKIGVNEATELKDLSEQLAEPFSNVLHGYMIEDIMYRISQSEYQKYLLLFDASPDKLRKIAFDSEGRLHYFYRKSIHKMTVPAEELDREKQYTICYYRIIKRLPYFTKTKPLQEEVYSFNPVPMDNPCAYHIADAHNMVDEPVAAAHRFCKEVGKIDFLILNGDVPEDSGKISNFDNVYQIISQITK